MTYTTRHSQGSPGISSSFRPLLIGGGRLARHFQEYLSQKKIPHDVFQDSRNLRGLNTILDNPNPSNHGAFTHFWLMVSDDALKSLSSALHDRYPTRAQIHSSAATPLPHALTLHPLMSFGPQLYSMNQYESFPLTLIEEELQTAPEFENLIKAHFQNRVVKIKNRDRGRYHLNCSMISNLSILLWSAAMRAGPGLEPEIFSPILGQTMKNFIALKDAALTGPLARRDQSTLDQHLRILEGSPESGLYQAFLEYHAHRT